MYDSGEDSGTIRNMKTVFLVIASVLTIASVVPYLIDILKGSTKPNLVSWITWTLLTGIATAAELAAGEYVAALFTAAAVVETGLVVAVGICKRAYVAYARFDVICQLSAIVGIVLWQLFDSPAIGVLASVIIDLIGALPTIRHSWQRPHEETWQTFAMCFVGATFGLLALDSFNAVSLPYPIYLVVINLVTSGVIIYRGKLATPAKRIVKG